MKMVRGSSQLFLLALAALAPASYYTQAWHVGTARYSPEKRRSAQWKSPRPLRAAPYALHPEEERQEQHQQQSANNPTEEASMPTAGAESLLQKLSSSSLQWSTPPPRPNWKHPLTLPWQPVLQMEDKGRRLKASGIAVVSGPIGARIRPLITSLADTYGAAFGYVKRHTTRPPKKAESLSPDHPGEYEYVTVEDFLRDVKEGKFLDKVQSISGHWYGYSIQAVRDVVTEGKICLLEIGALGASRLRERFHDTQNHFVFVNVGPGNNTGKLDMLRQRLLAKATDGPLAGPELDAQLDGYLKSHALKDLEFLDTHPSFYDLILVDEDDSTARQGYGYDRLREIFLDFFEQSFMLRRGQLKKTGEGDPMDADGRVFQTTEQMVGISGASPSVRRIGGVAFFVSLVLLSIWVGSGGQQYRNA